MRIIDLLNMIANKDKNLPKYIKTNGDVFRLDWHPGEGFFEGPVYYGASGFCLGARHSLDISLDDEVEIIEENKIEPYTHVTDFAWEKEQKDELIDNFDRINTILNKLLKEVNKLKKNK